MPVGGQPPAWSQALSGETVVGFARRVVRKSVRKATPRSVRRAMHPVRTTKNAITPRPIKKMSRAVYTVTNPLGAAENALIGSVLNAGGGHRRSAGSRGSAQATRRPTASPGEVFVGTGVRASEALESAGNLASLMAVQRERFTPAQRPVVTDPAPPDVAAMQDQLWARLGKSRPAVWKRAQRRQVRAQLAEQAAADAARMHEAALVEAAARRQEAQTWWADLQAGESQVLTEALTAAFADNVAPVSVRSAKGARAEVLLLLPEIAVLGAKQPHVTPSGRLSSRNWPKGELHEAYADLLGAHLLATAREAWAVGPSLTSLRVTGLRRAEEASKPGDVIGGFEVLFDVDLERLAGDWSSDDWGAEVLGGQAGGLRRTGKTQAVTPWPVKDMPAATLAAVTAAVGQ